MPLPTRMIKDGINIKDEHFQTHLEKYLSILFESNVVIQEKFIDINMITDIFMNFDVSKKDVCSSLQNLKMCIKCNKNSTCLIYKKFGG